jgi:hypothetical protein
MTDPKDDPAYRDELTDASTRLSDRESLSRLLAVEYGYLGRVDEEPVLIEEYGFGHLVFCRCCGFDGIATTARQALAERYRHTSRCAEALQSAAMGRRS